jgi:hypothetical protein
LVQRVVAGACQFMRYGLDHNDAMLVELTGSEPVAATVRAAEKRKQGPECTFSRVDSAPV